MMTDPHTGTDTPRPYQQAALDYWRQGWSPLPIIGKAGNVPTSYTGRDGRAPTQADVVDWSTEKPGHNIGLRLDGVVGIDVDDYTKNGTRKHGATTLQLAQNLWGPLPPTWRSTSREIDNPSGVRFYQVPPGDINLQSIITLPDPDTGEKYGDIEVLQYRHRYAIVWPSIHPDTRNTYRWYTPDGLPTLTHTPARADLPHLPQQWIEALHRGPADDSDRDPVDIEPQRAPRTEWSPAVNNRYRQACDHATGNAGSRHDNVRDDIAALARYETLAFPGATSALDELRTVFIETLADDRGSQTQAAKEYDDLVAGGRLYVTTRTSSIEEANQAVVEVFADIPYRTTTPPAAAGTPAPPADTPPTDRQGPENLAHWWDNNQPAPAPDLLARPDGIHLLYLQQLNWIHGESGSGKTWVILIAAAQHINNGGTCLWVHYEDPTPRPIIARLKLLGLPRQTAIERFHYWNPQGEPLDPHLILDYATQTGVDLVVIDSVGEALNASGLDENLDKDVGPWITHGPRHIVNAGIAVICIDHGTKAAEKPLYPSGSKRKRAAVTGAAYLIEAVVAPTAGTEGLLRVTCAKDRHGTHRQGDVVGLVRIAPDLATGGVTAVVNTPATETSRTVSDEDRRVREVVRIIDANPGLSKNQIYALMPSGRKQHKQEAVERAIADGEVIAQLGGRNAVLIYPKSDGE